MRNNYDRSRAGMIVFLGVLIGVLWLFIAISVYQEEQIQKYDVPVRPGVVTYGTTSAAPIPMASVVTPCSSAPMISGGAVRAYAHSGHATMPVSSSGNGSGYSTGYKLHTISSATVHSIGGGGSGGGGGTVSGGNSSSTNTIRYSTSISIPSLALAVPTRTRTSSFTSTEESATTLASSAASSAASPSRFGGIRRAPGYDGSYEGEQGEDGGKFWIWDGEGWIEQGDIPIGTTKIEGGITYRWNGTSWEPVSDQLEPGLPIGSTPWLLFLLLSLAYVLFKRGDAYDAEHPRN